VTEKQPTGSAKIKNTISLITGKLYFRSCQKIASGIVLSKIKKIFCTLTTKQEINPKSFQDSAFLSNLIFVTEFTLPCNLIVFCIILHCMLHEN
jgi:hypothetical protein